MADGTQLRGVEEALAALDHALAIEVASALGRVMRRVAAEARAEHPYEDHTYDLTRSIGEGDVTGSWSGGNLKGRVVATARYASYLDKRTEPHHRQDGGVSPPFAFLEPAWLRVEDEAAHLVEDGLQAAIETAGWDR